MTVDLLPNELVERFATCIVLDAREATRIESLVIRRRETCILFDFWPQFRGQPLQDTINKTFP